jgi:hypothetical protein
MDNFTKDKINKLLKVYIEWERLINYAKISNI